MMLVLCAPFALASDGDSKKKVDWDYSFDLTAGGEAGNKENFKFSLASSIELDATKWQGEILDLTISETAIRRDDEGEDERRTDRSFEYDGKLKRRFGRFNGTLSASWDDSLESRYLEDVWKVGLGVGATLHQGKKATFELDSVGVSYREETRQGEVPEGDFWLGVQHTFRYQFNEHATFKWDSDIQLGDPNQASESGRLLSDQELELDNKLGKKVSFVVKVDWELDSAPLAQDDENVKGWDLKLTFGVRIAN